jgi:DNA processing protein
LNDPKLYWIGFNLVKGIGAVRTQMLLDAFGDLQTAWKASTGALRQAGLSQKLVETFIQVRAEVDLELVWNNIQKQGIHVLTWEDPEYPRRLKDIDQSPPVLYIRGEYHQDDEWAVAIVGTRRVTAYGRQVTAEIAGALAHSGVTVISGLARGVDAVAHQSALDAGGRSLAVLGNGVDRVYPAEHRLLADRLAKSGALISDYAPGTPPEAINFPPRNRIISGLSMAVVVVEAGERSGALITANFAAEQGKEVFAVPGNIHVPQSAGTNRLIQQGAHPFLSVQDMLESLDLTLVSEQRSMRKAIPADEFEARLLGMLAEQPLHVDDISQQADLPIAMVTSTLALMELKGMVRQVGGMQYIAVREAPGEYRTGKEVE